MKLKKTAILLVVITLISSAGVWSHEAPVPEQKSYRVSLTETPELLTEVTPSNALYRGFTIAVYAGAGLPCVGTIHDPISAYGYLAEDLGLSFNNFVALIRASSGFNSDNIILQAEVGAGYAIELRSRITVMPMLYTGFLAAGEWEKEPATEKEVTATPVLKFMVRVGGASGYGAVHQIVFRTEYQLAWDWVNRQHYQRLVAGVGYEWSHKRLTRITKREGGGFRQRVFVQAVKSGDLVRVKRLIEEGVDVNDRPKASGLFSTTYSSYTALMWASKMGYTDVTKLLIEEGAYVNATDNYGNTALILASGGGQEEIVELLINVKADVNAGTKAVAWGRTTISGGIAEGETRGGYTALMAASEKGHVEVVKLLIEAGADVNAQTQKGGTFAYDEGASALMFASREGHLEIVTLLIDAGADVHAQDYNGHSALWYALEGGSFEVIHLLKAAVQSSDAVIDLE